MPRLVIISNRLPISIQKKPGGSIEYQRSAGGLATGLGSFYKNYESLWIGWPGIAREQLKIGEFKIIQDTLKEEKCYPVFLSRKDVDRYYNGFCNRTIWPLFHYFPTYVKYDNEYWETYKKVNKIFFDTVAEILQPDDLVWIHDYQLMLLPNLIREMYPEIIIGFFLHIPFPSYELFRLLPWRNEILMGFLGSNLIGFHTYDYARHFQSSVRQLLGLDSLLGQVNVDGRIVKVDAFPMGIDYHFYSQASKNKEIINESDKLKEKFGNRKIVISVDRLDYTKGIINRLKAIDLFLEKNPEYEKKFTLVLVVVPSRIGAKNYFLLKKQIDEMVGYINGKYGSIDWIPIWYLYRQLQLMNLTALYNIADVALVTPLRDGMNLVAKEYLATKAERKGVLILSEMAGAARELGEAIIVNPNDVEGIVEAIKKAFSLSDEEQIEMNRIMNRRLSRYTIEKWAKEFLDNLIKARDTQLAYTTKKLTKTIRSRIQNDYISAQHRLLLLDYDGTLVSFADAPRKAKPDEKLFTLLEKLTSDERNQVVIISGRKKDTLESWFDLSRLILVAEHGAWLKKVPDDWQTIEPLSNQWKEQIRPLMEHYVDWTPGSFLEEKDFSLVWHYRKADPNLADVRTKELENALLDLIANLNLGVLRGNKIVEVKNVSINKGRIASLLLNDYPSDFILAIGDDYTDEDIFSVLPETAHTIKMGIGSTHAHYSIQSPGDVRQLLLELTEVTQ
ncbi:MAG TPA: bifunctional alpha,alpha-trehalose-phosphate synthase (UDP-forming)/trehalose-phosphatase [Candidatus Atribacteria bacterium]|nr:bifunctional alpha,alpha-trehalose-phosphate synthase (UDP-forming)/trehalose-phosphatase [Candidatus Atribacteria bacterium]